MAKYADTWVPVVPGSDGAYLMACIHVILKEFYVDKETSYFTDYVKQYTNLPFLVILDKDGDKYQMGRFLRASDIAEYANEENADWKLIMTDGEGKLHLPTGSIGFRWEEEPTGNWNLQLKNAVTKEDFDPLLTLLERRSKGDGLVQRLYRYLQHRFGQDQKGKGRRRKKCCAKSPRPNKNEAMARNYSSPPPSIF